MSICPQRLVCFIQVLDAINGKKGMVECAFVQSDVCDTGYFASPVELGVGVISYVVPPPKLKVIGNFQGGGGVGPKSQTLKH